MLWLLAIAAAGCATPSSVRVPVEVEHVGALIDPPRYPLAPMAVQARSPGCEPLAEALRFVLAAHAGQVVAEDARVVLALSNCRLDLAESVTTDPSREAGLEATLSAQAGLHLAIERSGLLRDELDFSAICVEQQAWVAGGRYPWREAIGGRAQRDLVERIEQALMRPHPALRAERPRQTPPPP